jgi:hypothetical protein
VLHGSSGYGPHGRIHTWGVAPRRQDTDGFSTHGKKVSGGNSVYQKSGPMAEFFEQFRIRRVEYFGWKVWLRATPFGFHGFPGRIKGGPQIFWGVNVTRQLLPS